MATLAALARERGKEWGLVCGVPAPQDVTLGTVQDLRESHIVDWVCLSLDAGPRLFPA